MNIKFYAKKLIGRPTCVKAPSARLTRSARIINSSKDSSCITIGSGTVVCGELHVFAHGGCITLGEECYVGEGSRLWSGVLIEVGDRVLISHNVNIIDNLTHPLDPVARHAHARLTMGGSHPSNITSLEDEPIFIEDDAWIAAGAFVMKGVRIGRGGVVGAGAVVTADVPPMTVVVGNPARVVRRIETFHEKNVKGEK
jgi:acetyltransferase-like isoleucine patch superfamily enzyme